VVASVLQALHGLSDRHAADAVTFAGLQRRHDIAAGTGR